MVAVCWVASGARKKASVKEKNFKRLALKSMEQTCCDSKKIEANMLDPKSRRCWSGEKYQQKMEDGSWKQRREGENLVLSYLIAVK